MSRYREHNEVEMNQFQTNQSDGIYYNSIPGQRIAVSPTNSDYEIVTDTYEEANLSQDSNSYVNTLIRAPGERPTFESLGYDYEDTLTVQKQQQLTKNARREVVDKYHDYEDTLIAKAHDKCRQEGYDYEDVPDPIHYSPPPRAHAPSRSPGPKMQQRQEETVRPTVVKEAKSGKKYGAGCVRGLLLWSVLLLMLVIAAAVFIGLQQARLNTLEGRCNITVSFLQTL